MKTIKIAGAVTRLLEDVDRNLDHFRIQEILSEHRSNLISRVLNDLSTYLSFKFYMRVDKDIQVELKNRLLNLSTSKINLDRYLSIVHDIEVSTTYRVPSQKFFYEIDALLDSILNPKQQTLEIG